MADNFSLVSSCFQIHIYLLSPGSCSRWVTFKVSDKDKLMTKFPEKSAKITTSGGAMGKYLVFILDSDTHCKVFAEHVVSPQQIEMSVYLKHVHTVRQCCLCLQWPNIHSKLVINGRDNLRKQQWWSPRLLCLLQDCSCFGVQIFWVGMELCSQYNRVSGLSWFGTGGFKSAILSSIHRQKILSMALCYVVICTLYMETTSTLNK